MNILGKLFGSTKIVEAVTGTIAEGGILEKAFYTSEEKADNKLKGMALWLKIQEVTAQENSLKSITRRVLAWFVIGNFFIVFDIGVVLIILDKLEKVKVLKGWMIDNNVPWMVLSVIIFYFGYYGVQMIKGAKNA